MFLRIFFLAGMITWNLSEYPLMYPQKVLQGIPDRKRTIEFSIFNFLIMIEC